MLIAVTPSAPPSRAVQVGDGGDVHGDGNGGGDDDGVCGGGDDIIRCLLAQW